MDEKASKLFSLSVMRIADHIALDFLNTVAQVEGQPYDFFNSDRDVLKWLSDSGLLYTTSASPRKTGELLRHARALRDIILNMVQQKKMGKMPDFSALNAFLTAAESRPELVLNHEGRVENRRIYQADTPLQQLGPLAEQAAELFTAGDFQLVRQCEHPECTLWFYDRTKAHRRRWCSMAVCGNRAKAARFRQITKPA